MNNVSRFFSSFTSISQEFLAWLAIHWKGAFLTCSSTLFLGAFLGEADWSTTIFFLALVVVSAIIFFNKVDQAIELAKKIGRYLMKKLTMFLVWLGEKLVQAGAIAAKWAGKVLTGGHGFGFALLGWTPILWTLGLSGILPHEQATLMFAGGILSGIGAILLFINHLVEKKK